MGTFNSELNQGNSALMISETRDANLQSSTRVCPRKLAKTHDEPDHKLDLSHHVDLSMARRRNFVFVVRIGDHERQVPNVGVSEYNERAQPRAKLWPKT